MAAGPWIPTNTGLTKILNGTFDFDSDSFKVALFLSTSNLGAASTTFAGVTNEHAAANGYPAGGTGVTFTLAGTNPVTMSFTANPGFTASGGPITARRAAIYEVGGDIVAFCLLDIADADVTVGDAATLELDSDGDPNPVFSLAYEAA